MSFSKKEISNSIWLLSEKVIKLLGQIVLGVILARQLGAHQFGELNYIISYVYVFFMLSALGMENVLVKFLLERKDKVSPIISTALAMRFFSGITLFALAYFLGIFFFFKDASVEVMSAFLVMLLQLLVQPFDVFRLYFQSQLKSKIPSIALTTGYFLAAILRIYYAFQLDFIMIGVTYFLEVAFYSIIISFFFIRFKNLTFSYHFDGVFFKELIKALLPLIVTNLFYLVYVKADQIMLGKMSGKEEVAYYSVAARLSEAWYFIPVALVNSVYPSFVNLKTENKELFYSKLGDIFLFLSTISLFIAVLTMLLSYPVISLLYGQQYVPSAYILIVHIWCGFFIFPGVMSAAWMVNENKQNVLSQITIIGAFVNVVLNFLLIENYGALGVALSTLISRFLVSYFLPYFYPSTKEIFLIQSSSYISVFKMKGFKLIKDFLLKK